MCAGRLILLSFCRGAGQKSQQQIGERWLIGAEQQEE